MTVMPRMRPLGRGTDHVAYLADGDLVVRCVEGGDPTSVVRESDVLAAVAEVSPLPVPRPVRVDPDKGCLAYERLPGVALLEVTPAARAAQASSVAGAVGGLVRALHAVPLDRAGELVDVDDFSPREWLREATQHYARTSHAIPARHRPAVEAFLEAEPTRAPDVLALAHNDLGIEHVLVDPETLQVTGVIDWADAAIADPARDVALLYRDLGPAALDACAGGADEALLGRARFHARCGLLEDLAYGLEENRRPYVDKSLLALAWLFPA
jgi:aminoglycoside phosphotransferase (APT) family kinase protein